MKWLSRFSFHRRLQFTFLVLILLPFIVVTFWSYTSVRENVSDKITRSNEETLKVIANQLEKTVDNISFVSVYFSEAYDPAVLESLRYLKDAGHFGSYGVYTHYNKLKTTANILSVQSLDAELQIMLVNRDNRILIGNQDIPVFSELPERLLQESSKLDEQEKITLQWFPYGGDPAAPDYYYAVRFITDPLNQEKLATLYAGIPSRYFEELLDTGNSANLISLVDQAGRPIARLGSAGAAQEKSFLVSEVRIPKVGWLLSGRTPRSSVDSHINREFLISISVVGLFFLAFLILSMLWAGHINKPISLLRTSVKQYVGGNRAVRIPVKGKDEVAVLSAAFNQMLEDMNQLLQQVESEQEEKRLLELQALSAQIRPHFLLNTLNSIKVDLLLSGDQSHGAMIDALMKLLRVYVHVDKPLELAEECKVLGSYVQVMQIRNRLDITFDCVLDDRAGAVLLPRLLLQPVVENAISHGFSARPDNPAIRLEASLEQDMLTISISDNGRGMPDDKLQRLNRRLLGDEEETLWPEKGVGLINTARRLQVLYGYRSRLTAQLRAAGGMTFTFMIPVTAEKEAEAHDDPDVD
ncbi:sensor histidine kinase [Paenibacillus typhae]|uniref:histidine kinase n=1 Tax=Paenibacillus typhae TaxID=1174501 RepID=A0A1G8EX11_9BACL|nr:histidine kinase [Paenibacillus typhae]SDH74418.1 two-component system, sensor histidine kinase YesM [Paenibacillus typhae]